MRLHPDQGQYKLVETQIQQAIRRAQGSVGTPRDMMIVTGSGVATPQAVTADDTEALLEAAIITDGDETVLLPNSASHAGLTGASLHDPKAHAASHSTGGADAVDVDNILPTQTGNSGKYLTTDGSAASWDTPSTGSSSGQNYWSAAQLYGGGLTAHQTVLTIAGASGDVAGLTVIIPALAGTGDVTFTLYAYETSNGGRTTTIKWSSAALTENTDWSGVSLASLTSGSRTVDGTEELHAFVHTLARSSLTEGNLLNLVITCDSLKIVGLKIDW